MSLIDHPCADLAKRDGFPKGHIAKLFRGNIEDSHVAEADPFEHFGSLGR